MEKYKTIRVNKDYDEPLKLLVSTSHLKTEKEYTEAMISFFHNTGLDPSAPAKSVSGELTKLRNTVVGFIREQEKRKLNPIINYLNDITETLIHYLKDEALRRSDLTEFLELYQKENTTQKQKSVTLHTQNDNEVKLLFEEFLSKLQPGITHYKIDKKTVAHFKNRLNAL